MDRNDEVILGSKHYVREVVDTNRSENVYWYRISRRYLRRDGKKVPYVTLEKRDPEKHEWGFVHLSKDRNKLLSGFGKEITDKKLIRNLESHFDRDEKQRIEARQKLVLAMEEARNPSPPAERQKSSVETPKDKPVNKASVPSSTDDEIKRDKHGIKLWSHGGNYNLSVCVNNATKYPGNYSVSLLVAGRRLTYTFGKKEMKALAREVARALSAKELQELF